MNALVRRFSKVAQPLSADRALERIEQLAAFPCVAIDATIRKIAVEKSECHQVSYWDGSILAAEEALGAETLFSEDLNAGQQYGLVRVQNPFTD